MQTLTHAPHEQEFVMRDGTRLGNIKHLYCAILDMPDKEFAFFVNEEKNDFASWVEHCLNDKFLAASLRRSTSRNKMLKTLFMIQYK